MLLSVIRWLYSKLVKWAFRLLWVFSSAMPPPLPPLTDDLLLMTAKQLAQAIRERKVSSEEAVQACIKRIHLVNPLVNAVVDERFTSAIEEAQQVDRYLAEHIHDDQSNLAQERPLLGVPFTAKENVMIKGMSHTHGIVCRKGMKAEQDAGVVRLLREAGGIPLCVTNIPEMGIWWESFNNVYGVTCSPYDHTRTCGGSSGGEAVLLSSCCTFIGTGTDIGGSLRIPGAYSGVAGHKPTCGWVPTDGISIYTEKCLKGGVCVSGPMARNVSELPFILEIMAPKQAKGFQEKVEQTQLKDISIWYAEDLGSSPLFSPTDPKQLKILKEVLTYLENQQGQKSKKFPVDLKAAYKVWSNKCDDDFADEPELACDLLNRKGRLNIMKEFPAWFLGRRQYTFPNLLNIFLKSLKKEKVDPKTSPFYWKTLQQQCLDVLGSDGVIVMPTSPILAPYHYEPIWNPFDYNFTAIWNAVEFPVTQVPLGLTDDAQPIGLQVVSTPGNDHLCLAVAKMLEEKFGGWVNPSKIYTRSDKS
ncbi:unnamed protein product, partial [Meganyctiphanes norvegica]